jgi:AcrR family transcriptional regulator
VKNLLKGGVWLLGVEAKKRDKKERLIKAGVELFSRNGFNMTTVEDITREAGVAKGTFYLYFKDKRQFYGEILNSMVYQYEEDCKKIRAVSCPKEKLKMFIRSQLDFYQENADFARFTISAVGPEAESFIKWYVSIQKKHINFLADIIFQGCKEGIFDVNDVFKAAQFLQGAAFMFIAQHILSAGDPAKIDEDTEFIVNTFLEGILAAE